MSAARVSGILLAGGASRRFGGNKILAAFEGAPLFHRPLRALASACGEVLVVIAPSSDDPPLPADVPGARFIRDDVAFEGPLAGCLTGLRAAHFPVALVAAGDMPGLHRPVLDLLLRDLADADAAALRDGDRVRPLPLALRVAPARATAEALMGGAERRLRALVDALAMRAVPEETWRSVDADGAWRRDVDVPADLGRVEGG